MDESLEKRLAALEAELRAAKQNSSTERKRKKGARLRVATIYSRKRVIFFMLILLFVIALPTITYLHLSKDSAVTADSKVDLKRVQADAGFETYFPTALPEGFKFSPESVSLSKGVVFYRITIPNGAEVVVTQQARTNNFDYSSINTQTSFKTIYGVANVYEQGDKTMASLVSESTWLLCNSTKSIGAKAMETILQGMRTP